MFLNTTIDPYKKPDRRPAIVRFLKFFIEETVRATKWAYEDFKKEDALLKETAMWRKKIKKDPKARTEFFRKEKWIKSGRGKDAIWIKF